MGRQGPARFTVRAGALPTGLVVACCALAAAVPPARGAITVNTFQDEVVPHDGTCSLREAVAAANQPGTFSPDCPGAQSGGTTTIVLPAGAYHLAAREQLSITVAGVHVALEGTSGDPSLTTIYGDDGTGPTERGRVLAIAPGASVAVSGLTVRGGYTADGAPGAAGGTGPGGAGEPAQQGGGIYNAGTLTLSDVVVSDNHTGIGGAGGAGGTGPNLEFFPGGAGGAGGAGGGIYNAGALTLLDCSLEGNETGAGGEGGAGALFEPGGAGAQGGAGGGLDNGPTGHVSLTGTVVAGDHAGAGGPGGVSFVPGAPGQGGNGGGISSEGSVSAQAVAITHNSAGPGAGGGGLGGVGGGIDNMGQLALSAATIAGNAAGGGGEGGALAPTGGQGGSGGAISDSGVATLSDDTLDENSAGGGGGGESTSGGANAGNGGGAGGGGAIEYGTPGSMSLTALTIAFNAVGRPGGGGQASGGGSPGAAGAGAVGGAIEDAGASLTETSTLIAENSRPACGGAVSDGGYDLDYPAIDGSCPGVSGNPLLGPLSSNGGFAQTNALALGSAAIDQVPVGPACPPTDERGIARPQPPGGRCDIGAYEYEPPGTAAPVSVTVTVHPPQKCPGCRPALFPALSHLRVTPSAFADRAAAAHGRRRGRPRRTGAIVAYLDSRAATSTFAVQIPRAGVLQRGKCVAGRGHAQGRHSRGRHPQGRRCTSYVTLRTFTHGDRAGANSFHLSGIFDGRPLAPGRYRLRAVPALGGVKGRAVTAFFGITP